MRQDLESIYAVELPFEAPPEIPVRVMKEDDQECSDLRKTLSVGAKRFEGGIHMNPVAVPILARYAREGVQVHLLIATDGGQGTGFADARGDTVPRDQDLVRVRTEEARRDRAGSRPVRDARLSWARQSLPSGTPAKPCVFAAA